MKTNPWDVQDDREGVADKTFLSSLPKLAQQALLRAGLTNPNKLAEQTERSLLALHGVGPAALPKLRTWLRTFGLAFKTEEEAAKEEAAAAKPKPAPKKAAKPKAAEAEAADAKPKAKKAPAAKAAPKDATSADAKPRAAKAKPKKPAE